MLIISILTPLNQFSSAINVDNDIPVMAAQPAKVQTAPDETQFWVCPHCGGDTQYRQGKQFCGSCNLCL